jgi:hypothetical protein
MQKSADRDFPSPHGWDFAAQPSIKAQATAGALDDKQEHQHRE